MAPLTPKILTNPNHLIVKRIVYVYSMESFIYREMNWACREQDHTKIKFYGPLASVLSFILQTANRKNRSRDITTFRGVMLSEEDINAKYAIGNQVHITGYTSTTLNKNIGLKFALPSVYDAAEDPKESNTSFIDTNNISMNESVKSLNKSLRSTF